ncbi:MAG: hypothetical protein KF841_12885 [Phycisphaerae bacterium]|nr:hypothetical protein [Phycisphaerae bacterium]
MDQGISKVIPRGRASVCRHIERRLHRVCSGVTALLFVTSISTATVEGQESPIDLLRRARTAQASQLSKPGDGRADSSAKNPDRDDSKAPGSNTGTEDETGGAANAATDSSPSANAGAEIETYVRVSVDNRVTMHVAGLPLSEAVRMISEPTQRNIILAKGVDGTVTATLYDVTFEAALDAMLLSNGLGYRSEGSFIFVYPLEELERFREAERKVETRVFRLSYVRAGIVKELLETVKSPNGKIAVTPVAQAGLGGASGPTDTHGDALSGADMIIATDLADRLDAMEDLLAKVDVRPEQVLIEATILRASLNEQNALGIDFTTVGGIDFAELSSTSPAAQSITTGQTPSSKLEQTTLTARTDFNSNVPGGGFTFGIIKDQIGAFVRALETITDTNIIANPKVLALNKQFGQVIVGRRDGYLTTTITETTAVQTVEFLETGTILTFRPFIGSDGYVRMEIHPKDSTGGLTAANLPFEQTTEVTTNIMVKDGNTILIGGLFREVGTSTRSQVPLLGNIPGLGAMFRSTNDDTIREEVIVLLTVHIVKPEADFKASEELGDDVERFRVGMRRGVQWFGRERLAQAHFSWALKHLARGNLDKALWDAEIAMLNYPRHVEALKLAEKIKGQRMWENEASSVRTFVRDQILRSRGIEMPAFGRPAPPYVIPESDDMEADPWFMEQSELDSRGGESIDAKPDRPATSQTGGGQ